MFSFNRCNSSRVNAAHLAGAHTNGAAVFGVNDGVRLDHLGNFPSEQELVHLLITWLSFGDHFQVAFTDHAVVFFLDQQAAINALVIVGNRAFAIPFTALEQTHVFLG